VTGAQERFIKNVRKAGDMLVENHQGSFAISPSKISEKLINRFVNCLRAFLNFAFRNKCSPTFRLDAQISLTGTAKCFSRSIAFVVAI
jgi:hypothetical protein